MSHHPNAAALMHLLSTPASLLAMDKSAGQPGGTPLRLRYQFADTALGAALIAASEQGICHWAFEDNPAQALNTLSARFPSAQLIPSHSLLTPLLAPSPPAIKLHLQGTEFQLKVWQALLSIPLGQVVSYGALALQLGQPKAARALGSAIGRNSVALLIPCHRVITASGKLGGYRWGEARKRTLIDWEAAHAEHLSPRLLP
jgi:AraC family transcriptional regulator, regulatory protein of adaptative response / methylated-DNA-[protein]-cysteine methyltransferase